jgi:hypothetical protein
MSAKRRSIDDRQVVFSWNRAWADPADLLRASDGRGAVLFEAPEVSRIVRGRSTRLPRVRLRDGQKEPDSYGLPFGMREYQGRLVCWSCALELGEDDVIRSAPGHASCPGCGARLPFTE